MIYALRKAIFRKGSCRFHAQSKLFHARGAEFLLMHRIFNADHHKFEIINKSWFKRSFPFFYGYNILRGLDVLTRLGYVKDERLNDAVQILPQKRQKDGSWVLESSPAGRLHVNIESKRRSSKWITLIVLRVLKRQA